MQLSREYGVVNSPCQSRGDSNPGSARIAVLPGLQGDWGKNRFFPVAAKNAKDFTKEGFRR
jgi:hypothetical protein